jgi:2-polyprenyl-3-methyl-5-hydroxy-6-metoxy-1,4-benzoquinol methylase
MKNELNDDIVHDDYGEAILEELESANRLSEWMFESIAPYLGNRILEIGSGIGNISRQLPVREKLTLSDYSEVYRKRLSATYADEEKIDILNIDLTKDESFQNIQQEFDSIICLNVLEHIEDDIAALERMKSALAPGGHLVILVPQYALLMSKMDKLLGHFRRYSKNELKKKFETIDMVPVKTRNFNALGAGGWFVSNTVMGNTEFGSTNIKVYESLVPVFKPIEKRIPLPGLSVIGVAEKR